MGKDSKALLLYKEHDCCKTDILKSLSEKRVLINPFVPTTFRHSDNVHFIRNHQQKLTTVDTFVNALSNRWSNVNELCHRDTADSLRGCFRWLMSPVLSALLWRFKCCQMETPGSSEQLGVLPVHCTTTQFPLKAWWDEKGKRAKLSWCQHLPKEHGAVSEYAVSDWKACTSILKRVSYNSHLPQDMSSAAVMPQSFILCFNELIHPTQSFWATLVLGNSVTLKAEVQGQQLFVSVDAPQRRRACWTSHLKGEKQFP